MNNKNKQPKSLFYKIWDRHEILTIPDGPSLLYIDRDMIHEGSFHAFISLRSKGLTVRKPKQVFGIADHYVPTKSRKAADAATPEIEHMINLFDENMAWGNVNHYGIGDSRQGIVHVVGPEQGITLPGLTMVCSDSHTSTHGALGAIAFGIGQSENTHVMATQTLWQKRPKIMRINVTGKRHKMVSAKDIILAIIGKIGASGATGHAIEYAGNVIREMSIEERLTVCNMSIEAGARCGMVAPDDTTFEYLYGRPYAPKGALWDQALIDWQSLPSDSGAIFDVEVDLDASALEPMVTWGTSPEDTLPIGLNVPDPESFTDPRKQKSAKIALAYMGLKPNQKLEGIPIDQVFIGSCTNSRLEDLKLAAEIIKGRKVVVPSMVVPGSTQVRQAAEAIGLHKIFIDAGMQWLQSGCSMCAALNGDIVQPGKRCASTTNRNFVGRQGPGSRTHLMSPAMAAAAAVTGKLTDVRKLL